VSWHAIRNTVRAIRNSVAAVTRRRQVAPPTAAGELSPADLMYLAAAAAEAEVRRRRGWPTQHSHGDR
jgi:hypothetical protein